MRILHVLPPSYLGALDPDSNTTGLAKSVYLLDRALTEMGHHSAIAWTRDSKPCGKLFPVLEDASPPPRGGQSFPVELFRTYKEKIRNLLRKEKFDIIHSQTAPLMWNPRELATVLTLRLPPEMAAYVMGPYIVPHVKVVAISHSQKRNYLKSSYSIDQVIYNGLDCESFPVVDTPIQKRKHLLCLGGIDHIKGQHHAIAVAQKTGIPLVVAGNIWNRNYFNEKISPHIDGRLITYIGHVNREQRLKAFSQAKALLMPAEIEEPFGMAALEALASGVPVVGFSRGALPELVVNGKSGYLVSPSEGVPALARAVLQLDSIDPFSCRETAVKFDYRNTAREYLRLYESLT